MTTTELTVLRVFVGPDGRGGNPLAYSSRARRSRPTGDRPLPSTSTSRRPSSSTAASRAGSGSSRRSRAAVRRPPVGRHVVVASRDWHADRRAPSAGRRRPRPARPAAHLGHRRPGVGRPRVPLRGAFLAGRRRGARPAADGRPRRYVWSWIDESAGELRSRCFPTDFGIAEDEATGLAAVILGGRLKRPLTIRQGVGSEILVRPQPDGMVEIGGRVELVERRPYEVAQ